MQFFDEWLAVLAAALQALLADKAVDLPFDIEQASIRLTASSAIGEIGCGFAATFGVRGDVGQHEELAA